MSKVIGVIPARSGSEGLLDKNVLPWGNTSILEHSVNVARESKIFDKIIVTSDSNRYLDLIVSSDDIIKHKRPSKLSTSKASIIDLIKYLSRTEKLFTSDDIIILLQPTSPLRNTNHIVEAFNLFITNESVISVVSACKPFNHRNTLFDYVDEKIMLNEDVSHKRRQDFFNHIAINGSIYIEKYSDIEKFNTFISTKTMIYLMEKKYSIDIDDSEDYIIAKALAHKLEV